MTVLPPAIAQRPGLAELVAALGGPGDVRIVGGAVRDGLLGLAVSDIDLATVHPPDTVIARLEASGIKAVPTGIAHGTVTAVVGGQPVEVTTLRRDVATDGRHAVVAFGTDWGDDARRRDFTINALYADPVSGEVFDPVGGLPDLARARVAFIGAPLTRIAEDHLRILRFFRFHARFGKGPPDAEGLSACAARANDLMALSRERIASELLKLLLVADPIPTLAIMVAHGIFTPVLPEITATEALARVIAREAEAGVPAQAIRRLAALIPRDPAVAKDVAARLRLSNADARRLVLAAGRPRGRPEALAYTHGIEGARDALLLGDGPARAATLVGFTRPVMPIKGGDLIARGLAPGPGVAATLLAIERAWVAAGFPDGAEFSAIVARELAPYRNR